MCCHRTSGIGGSFLYREACPSFAVVLTCVLSADGALKSCEKDWTATLSGWSTPGMASRQTENRRSRGEIGSGVVAVVVVVIGVAAIAGGDGGGGGDTSFRCCCWCRSCRCCFRQCEHFVPYSRRDEVMVRV